MDAEVPALEERAPAATGREDVLLTPDDVRRLVDLLVEDGRRVLGPRLDAGVVDLGELRTSADLAVGTGTETGPGHQQAVERADEALFGAVVGPTPPKRWLSPPRRLLWRAQRTSDGFTVFEPAHDETPTAFVGLRPCDVVALGRLDQVLGGPDPDPDHAGRREASVVVAVACHATAATCFCASAGTGPGLPDDGFDVGLVEVLDGEHRFVARAGSEVGAALLARLGGRPGAGASDHDAAEAQAAAVAAAQERTLPGTQGRAGGPPLAAALAAAVESPRWADVGNRCLACGNCTQVCPTCFCHSVEDHTDLTGQTAERWRRWDSCFTGDFSRLHAGSVRTATAARYRQWLSHKLGTWWDQFGTSGCVGCGRCITWCPVGIDLTEEAHILVGGRDPRADAARVDAFGVRIPSSVELQGAVIT